jgi:D-lactate dehydrogenase (cytochrome)
MMKPRKPGGSIAALSQKAVELGGTISAEHGIGKLKREYLRELYGDQHLREMAALKRAFDPAGILGRGNMFDEALLNL